MKIKVIINPKLEDDVVLECREMTPQIEKLIKNLETQSIHASHRGKDISINLNDICFFETEDDAVYAHTARDSFRTHYRLYELESSLPSSFMRASKSTIVNLNQIDSIERNITSSRSVQFYGSHKITYVSRMYFQQIKKRLKEESI
ncbi:LytTR family transcriptional regulator [Erysipelothrix rhusiopathiae]|uniref:LytTR family transcriptional regulator n=1 Tax=Erysipelothrix piscisicarius TaxID=2485784 RepID=A0A3Q8S358_9FIRM|nr:LytTR family DNA-binding domain-containing protein [Erysipelothrix piscisicarius]AZK44663.1 LytTR family transcriptional regulator [Erysipelothrix piscisicarius]MBK2403734.1 LytTR family transcriptional regulator [Erysipelothrix sp. strain 2 (EsS2-7-Brazil)]NBA01472.1 LytTR family transcriptional regulator [Erysipelothrix rhusiopathiae]